MECYYATYGKTQETALNHKDKAIFFNILLSMDHERTEQEV